MHRGERPTPDFIEQMKAARRADADARAAGRRALSASYDRTNGRVIIELTNGCVFGFIPSRVAALAGLSPAELSRVTVSPGGSGLFWDDQDIQLSVPGLLLDAIDPGHARSELARIAGRSRSHAKAAAARANGKKGGRPRKKAATAKPKTRTR